MVTVRFLEPKDEASFREALAEDWGSFAFANYYEPEIPIGDYIRRLELKREGKALVGDEVPSTFLYAFVPGADGKDRCVGRVSIRHRLNDWLAQIGGHIGYGVRPSDRKKGYATEILGQALTILKMIGVDRALLTCDDGNLGSIRTIERNGGALEGKLPDPATGVLKRRYWIAL